MCPGEMTCLPVDCCFSELTLCMRVGLVQNINRHHQDLFNYFATV